MDLFIYIYIYGTSEIVQMVGFGVFGGVAYIYIHDIVLLFPCIYIYITKIYDFEYLHLDGKNDPGPGRPPEWNDV